MITWHVINGKLTNDYLPEPLTAVMTEPYPLFWWYVNDNKLVTELLPNPLTYYMMSPYPPFWWYVDNNKLKNINLPPVPKMGAFSNCTNLKRATISKNVKYIGDFTFADTDITEVTIASDCSYKDTSFPDGCTINFYPN